MEASRPSSSTPHFSSSATVRLSSAKASSASTEAPNSADQSCAILSFQPFVKKYAWAAVGVFIAISGSIMLLAASQSSAKQTRRSSAVPLRGLASQEVQRTLTSRALHSQGTNTEEEADEEVTIKAKKGKASLIVDADVCSPVPELIIRDTRDSTSAVHSLIDTDTLDRSAPLTIYSSLTCPIPETIRRPVSWSEPYINKEELESYTSYNSQAIEEPLKPHNHISLTPTKRKSIPILGPTPTTKHDNTIPILDPSSSSSCHSSPPIRSPLSSSKIKDTLDSYTSFPLIWTQVRFDLFLVLSILSFLFYYFYLKRDIHKHFEIQPVKPFPVFRLFP